MRVSRCGFAILLWTVSVGAPAIWPAAANAQETSKPEDTRASGGAAAESKSAPGRAPKDIPVVTPARWCIRRRTAMSETDDTPRTDDAPRRSSGDVLARLLSYLVAATTILGIPIGLYGYYASQQANRVNRTFDFCKDFRGDGLQKDFSLLVTRWNEKSAQADGFLKSDDFTGLSQLAASLLQTDETQTALSRLILFFDEAYSTSRCATTMPPSRCCRIPPTRFFPCMDRIWRPCGSNIRTTPTAS
jgi:hypothetical protein